MAAVQALISLLFAPFEWMMQTVCMHARRRTKGNGGLDRKLVSDVAILAEQLVMFDMPRGWEVAPTLSSREQAAPFFPDRIADVAEKPDDDECFVRSQREKWAEQLAWEREASVVEWIDTGIGTEKAAVVMRWRLGLAGCDTIVVCFRGSKSTNDWMNTNLKAIVEKRVIDLSERAYADALGPNERLHTKSYEEARQLSTPWAPLTMWRAYAGQPGREEQSPRGRIHRVVSDMIEQSAPAGGVLVTGHSLGGSLATLCAYDLLVSNTTVQGAGVTLVPVSAVPAFNVPFQRRMAAFASSPRLVALHVTAAGDFAPKVKGSALALAGTIGVHGVTSRLVLNADDPAAPMYYVPPGVDDECADLAKLPFDQYGHNRYAKDLSGLGTPDRPQSVPLSIEWPVPEKLS